MATVFRQQRTLSREWLDVRRLAVPRRKHEPGHDTGMERAAIGQFAVGRHGCGSFDAGAWAQIEIRNHRCGHSLTAVMQRRSAESGP